jgi:hypothetical protein
MAIAVLKVITAIGFLLAIWGLAVLHAWLALLGTVVTILGKTWFLDRMVWLYQDLRGKNAQYQTWLY